MNGLMKRLRLLIMICAVCIPAALFAQPGGFDDDVTDNPVPFDGGVILLVATAIGYGVQKKVVARKTKAIE